MPTLNPVVQRRVRGHSHRRLKKALRRAIPIGILAAGLFAALLWLLNWPSVHRH